MKTNPTVEICDHCGKIVDELWADNHGWHLCPLCWFLYHVDEPKNECNFLTFKKRESAVNKICMDDVDNAELSFSMTCEFCSDVFAEEVNQIDYEDTKTEIAGKLNEAGWGMKSSEKYTMIGVACPDCLAKEDGEL